MPSIRHRDAYRRDDGGSERGGASREDPIHRFQRVVSATDSACVCRRGHTALRLKPAPILVALAPARRKDHSSVLRERHLAGRLVTAGARCALRQISGRFKASNRVTRAKREHGTVYPIVAAARGSGRGAKTQTTREGSKLHPLSIFAGMGVTGAQRCVGYRWREQTRTVGGERAGFGTDNRFRSLPTGRGNSHQCSARPIIFV